MLRFSYLVVALLSAAVLILALAVIGSKYQARKLFLDIVQQERELEQYEVQWGQMQLELTMLADQNRVETLASQHLKLLMPVQENIIYVKPPSTAMQP